MKGWVHSCETLGTLDGPGVRFVIFLQGCELRCQYCHNPDTWPTEQGERLSAEELVHRIIRYQPYFGKYGGVTVSGGEPLLQPEFLLDLFQRLSILHIKTALDTSGCVYSFEAMTALELADLVLLDIKHTEEAPHRVLTTSSMIPARKTLSFIQEHKRPFWVRSVIVPGVNDSLTYATSLAKYLNASSHKPERVELLSFHNMALSKWTALGMHCPLEGVGAPDMTVIRAMEKILCDEGLPVVSMPAV